MSEPTTTGETPQAQPVTGPTVDTPQTEAQQPAQEPVEEWDKERAARTIKAQREEAKALKAQLAELDQLKAEKKQREDAALSETERLRKQATEAAAQVQKLQADIWRRDVVAETGIPSILADRINGATKEEMLADAKKLAEALPKQSAPKIPPTNPGNADPSETAAQQRARLFGSNADPFAGGGVVWNKPPQ